MEEDLTVLVVVDPTVLDLEGGKAADDEKNEKGDFHEGNEFSVHVYIL